jgi:diketogulonate reductase-like aldo/keto reductase
MRKSTQTCICLLKESKEERTMEYYTFENGVKAPMEGFGVFQVPDLKECEDAVYTAIQNGYRLIDTAAAYMNEEAVGKAVKRAIADGLVKREDLFIVTKLWVQDMESEETAARAIETSLKKLNLDYMDAYMPHQAMKDVYGSWRAIEKAYQAGKIRVIGVSNFYPARLTDLWVNAEIKPMFNQVELHPFFQQTDAVENMKRLNVLPVAWGPFAEGKHNLFSDPVLTEIGKQYGKTAAQVALRWNVQRGVLVLPKSVHSERQVQNFDIWDFKLSEEDMKKIAGLNAGQYSEIINHFDPKVVEMVEGVKIHD